MTPLSDREHDFKVQVNTFSLTYPKAMLDEFESYWSEPNRSGTKMKWELEKTWHLGRRLARWANNDFGKGKVEVKKEVKVEAENEFTEINKVLAQYQSRPTNFTIEYFRTWYEFLRSRNLLKDLIPEEVESIKLAYLDRNRRIGAWVMKTFDFYGTQGRLFSELKTTV